MIEERGIYYLFDKKTKQIERTDDNEKFAKWFLDIEGRTVEKTNVLGFKVSTVCLGINHNIHPQFPMIFETAIFDAGGSICGPMKRYSTFQEAKEGHAEAVEWVKEYGAWEE